MSNLFRALKELLPAPPLQIATVISIGADNTSVVEFFGGSRLTVLGASVGVGQPAFVRNGVIEGVAPDRAVITIEL